MTKLLMLADDYTGVLDTAVQFCKSGLSVAVTTRLNRAYIDARQSADVIALDTETRHLPPKDAYETVYRAARLAREAGIPYLYKKTDSTLRGNIGAEIAAAMDAYQSPYCAFLPAFIRQGRTTKGGIHYVNGILLGKAPIARDPFNPLYTSSVAEILRLQTVISLPAPVPPAPPSGYGEGILVFDAQSDAHIQACAAFIAQSGIRVMAGCAGLAEYVGSISAPKAESRRRACAAQRRSQSAAA